MTAARAGKAPVALRPLKVPRQLNSTLSNGMQITLVPRGPLPLVSVRLVVRAGAAFDPVDRKGVADFAARLLRRGAGGKTADEISEAVEFVGASISGWASEDAWGVALNTPARHLAAMLPIFGSLILEPDFPEPEVELLRRRTLAQITNELDDPGALADRALLRAVWNGHPYGHEVSGSMAAIRTVQRTDLSTYVKTRVGPGISHLFLVGDVAPDAVLPMIEKIFGGWRAGPSAPLELPAWPGAALRGQVVIVDKPEQTQVQLRIGSRGVRRGHPDHFPLAVMSTVLGGGFTSRLVTEIRVKRGLSYGAGCHFDMLASAGAFTVSSFTKNETIEQLIKIALAEVAKMRARGPTPKEVATVQRYISGLYPARLETNDAIAGALSDVAFYGLPDDWISQYRERICAVTPRQATEAARAHLFDKGEEVVVLVGNAALLQPKVAKLGPVSVWKPSQLE
jgi:zinc protease